MNCPEFSLVGRKEKRKWVVSKDALGGKKNRRMKAECPGVLYLFVPWTEAKVSAVQITVS